MSKRIIDVADRIQSARIGHEVCYVDPASAYRSGYVSWSKLNNTPGDGLQPFVIVSGARDESAHGQITTLDRSNYRSLLRDFGDAFIRVSWSDCDGLGIFLHSVSDDVFNTVMGLAYDYPVYDESDMSEIEWDEISEAFDAYLWSDLRSELDDNILQVADMFSDAEIRDAFYACMSERGEHPEHDGHDVLWSSVDAAGIAREAIESLALSLGPSPQVEVLF